MKITSIIKQQDRGVRCIDFLSNKFKYLTYDQWLDRISEGRFTIEDNVCNKDTILNIGDILVYDAPPFKEPDADLNYSVVYENEDFLAVNKPGNLLVHKKGAAITHNLIYQLREVHNPPFKNADIVNRLDKETSGIVLVSKHKDALKELIKLFSDRAITKEYIAVTYNNFTDKVGYIDVPIKKGSSEKIRSKQVVDKAGKEAYTTYKVLATWDQYALVWLSPKTGRTHQLRVHLNSIGCTIVGDKIYGLSEDEFVQWKNNPQAYKGLEFSRQALHSFRLSFTYKDNDYSIFADIPADMKSIIPKEYHNFRALI